MSTAASTHYLVRCRDQAGWPYEDRCSSLEQALALRRRMWMDWVFDKPGIRPAGPEAVQIVQEVEVGYAGRKVAVEPAGAGGSLQNCQGGFESRPPLQTKERGNA